MLKRILLSFVTLVGLMIPAGQAYAEPIQVLNQINDNAGVLSASQETELQTRLDELTTSSRYRLFVIFMDSFNGENSETWTNGSFAKSNMGKYDVLMAVAVKDKAYWVTTDKDIPLSSGELDSILYDKIRPALHSKDWYGAVVAAAEGFQEAANTAEDTVAQTPMPEASDVSQSGVSGADVGAFFAKLLGTLGVIAVISVVIFGAIVGVKAAKRRKADRKKIEKLMSEVAVLVAKIDEIETELVKDIDFIKGHYSAKLSKPFTEGLDALSGKILHVHALKQPYDKGERKSLQEQRALAGQILKDGKDVQNQADSLAQKAKELIKLDESFEEVLAQESSDLENFQVSLSALDKDLEADKAKFTSSALERAVKARDSFAGTVKGLQSGVSRWKELASSDRSAALEGYLSSANLKGELEMQLKTAQQERERLDEALLEISSLDASLKTEKEDASRLAPKDRKLATALAKLETSIIKAQGEGLRDPVNALDATLAARYVVNKKLASLRDEERKLQKARKDLKSKHAAAEAAVSDAENSASDPDASRSTRSTVKNLRKALSDAESRFDSDPVGAVSQLDRIISEADAAASKARREVRNARDSRAYTNNSSSSSFIAGGAIGYGIGSSSGWDSGSSWSGGDFGGGGSDFGGGGGSF